MPAVGRGLRVVVLPLVVVLWVDGRGRSVLTVAVIHLNRLLNSRAYTPQGYASIVVSRRVRSTQPAGFADG
ncbi:hypothetical protein Pa4123_38050 [Phytohabitans aurantiacus]|uniref:Secreted protein n=1 Tax=Phytohabitans aurantiacus TaxID=3016789 RepID=A0ABQ5QVC4_9ACTN|nr:hypothetical protein Pa4123_38050 [Phytohabitans aurantiacus]